MNAAACRTPIADDALVDYWLGDADEANTAAIDEHLLGCDACGARLDALAALGHAVRAAVGAGLVGGVVGAAVVERLVAAGRRVREYRVPPGGAVACTIAPDDDAVVSRLEVALAGVERLDALVTSTLAPGPERLVDLPFAADAGELILLPNAARLRALPAHRLTVRLLAVEPGGERVLGDYRFDHRPWPGA